MFSSPAVPQRLWIFDFDGTLSRLVPDRNAAEILPEAADLLRALARMPRQAAAVLSSRRLEDLIGRVGIDGIHLGGGSGAEWRLADGEKRAVDSKAQRLEHIRKAILPEFEKLKSVPGLDLEDKKWSVAVHVRQVAAEDRSRVHEFLESLVRCTGIRLLRGPAVFEMLLLPEIDKLFGVLVLCELLRFDPAPGALVFAGDDDNDAVAMDWVIRKGGVALAVGEDPIIPGVPVFEGPEALVREVRRLAGLDSAP